MSATGSPAKRSRREVANSGIAVANEEEGLARGNTKLRGITSFEEEEGDYMANMDGGSEDLDSSDLGSEDDEQTGETRDAAAQPRKPSSAKSLTFSSKGSRRRIKKKKGGAQEEEEKTTEGGDGTGEGARRKEANRKMPSSVNKPAADSVLMLQSVY